MHRTLTIAALSIGLFAGADWTRLRGPNGSGVSGEKGLPLSWSSTENVVWKTALPGFGSSSPITLGEKIFLTCYSGYGLDRDEPGDQQDLKLHLVCIDRADGRILWDGTIRPRLPEQDYDAGFVSLHGYASGTPVTDGEAVYAFFGRSGAVAYTPGGRFLWRADCGSGTHRWGSGTSPILAGDLLIINASVESGSIVALDKTDGKEVWRAEGIHESWSTPALVDLPNGKQELAVSMHGKVLGYDPATGRKLWQCDSVQDYVCPLVVARNGIVYVTGGRRPMTVAIRAGGRGDVTGTHLLWKLKECSKVPSPLVHDGLLYWVSNRAVACCIDAATGKVLYEERLNVSGGGDKFYASVILADGKLYALSRRGETLVLAAGSQFKQLALNDLGDGSIFNATPVVSNGRLLIRSDRFLYCIGK